MRGIVVGHQIDTSNGFSMNGSINNDDVLKWLLYWDHITYAGIGFEGASITGAHSPDVEYLEQSGVFNTKIVDISELGTLKLPAPTPNSMELFGLTGNQFQVAASAARLHLSKTLSEENTDIWTIGQTGGERLILPRAGSPKEMIDVQLVNCLPIPKPDTPFDDILEFKHRYQDELDILRATLDGLRENILNSPDEKRATDNAILSLSKSISDVRHALEGRGVGTISETISLYLNNPSLTFWTALGGIGTASIGLPVDVGLASGIAIPTAFKFSQRFISGASSLPENQQDFIYTYEALKRYT